MKKILMYAIMLTLAPAVYSQPDNFYDELKKDVAKDVAFTVNTFKKIHANPELGFEEIETSKIVAKELRAAGFEVHTGIGKTGVIGIVRNGKGPAIMIRSDMDALPMKEQTNLPYASNKTVKQADGSETPVAHSCGHDAHVAWLLGVARQMTRTKNLWSGTLIAVAQPAEELLSGADAMVKDGLYDFVPKPDVLISAHTSPTLPAGKVGIREGRRLTGSTSLDVTIKGIGGHGSSPHLAKDPIVIGSLAVMEYQTLVSRSIEPSEVAVVSVGSFQSGSVNNIIPDQAVLKLNLRWFNEDVRDTLLKGIHSITDHAALGLGLSSERMPTYKTVGGTMPVINNTAGVEQAKAAMIKALGEENVLSGDLIKMASEDFHRLAAPSPQTKIVWIEIGSGKPNVLEVLKRGGEIANNHNPEFKVELAALSTAVVALSSVGYEFMKKN